MPNYQQQDNLNSSSQDEQSDVVSPTGTSQELLGNQRIIEIIKTQNSPTGQRELNPNKNGIVFMGLNEYAHHEGQALNRYNRGAGGAITAVPLKKQDHIKRNGVEFDLTTEEGAALYVSTLGLSDQLAVKAAEFLLNAGNEARDELAQFVRILSEAEMGERKIDRMVLSGHSVGSQIWGDHNGTVKFDDIKKLVDLFPEAMGQVDHLFMSACYSGGERGMHNYREMFENLQSVFAYHDSSPGTWSGALDHMAQWEKATELGKDASGVDPDLAKGIRKAKNVSTWNVTDGYQGGEPMQMYELENMLADQEGMFQSHYSGELLIENAQSGPLREYYGNVQSALNHNDASADFISRMASRRDVTIRLLYYTLISGKFYQHYFNVLSRDYDSKGVALPDFSQLNRREALEHIEANAAKLGGTESLGLLQRGLRNLSSEIIPTGWV
jgi:hypothetical protein